MEKKILIIEDELSIRTALITKFTAEGFEVFEAVNGEEGLKMAEEHVPNLILLDIQMPRMDGITMLQKLRLEEWGKDMHVIMLTNNTETDRVAETLELGAYDYLVKSDWKLQDIVEKVRGVLA